MTNRRRGAATIKSTPWWTRASDPPRPPPPERLLYWTDPKNHADALTLVHALFDAASFRVSEDLTQIPRGRLHAASWSGGGIHEYIDYELSALASRSISPHRILFAMCFLPGRAGSPWRPESIAEFDAAYDRALHFLADEKRRKKRRWLMAMPAQLPPGASLRIPRMFRVDGRNFTLRRVETLPSELRTTLTDRQRLLRTIRTSEFPELPTLVLTFEATAADFHDAWDEVAPSFGLLRSVLDFFSSGTWRLGGSHAPRTRWPHPKWVVGFDGRSTVEGTRFIAEDPAGRPLDRINAGTAHNFIFLLRLLREPTPANDIRSLIADCLRLYGDALDATRDYWAFLGFWQVLERAALVEESGGVTKEIAKRIRWLVGPLGLPGTGYEHSLLKLGKLRNDLAHAGRSEAINETDVNMLWTIADQVIMRLIRTRRVFFPRVGVLRAAYKMRSMTAADLEAHAEGIRAVEEIRTK